MKVWLIWFSGFLMFLFGCASLFGTTWAISETWALYQSPVLFTILFFAWLVVFFVVLRVWVRWIERIL